MRREAVLLKNKENRQKKAIAGILRRIADNVEHGSLQLQQGTGSFVVDFPEDITLEIKAEEDQKQKVKFSFQLEFFVAYHGQDSIAID